jgi:hypothetical protein
VSVLVCHLCAHGSARWIADVERGRDGGAACWRDEVRRRRQIAVACDDDRRSAFGETDGNGLSDAAGGSGHDRDPPVVRSIGCWVGHLFSFGSSVGR